MPNATGWNELFAGNMISAAFTMYDTAFGGWFVALVFLLYQFMLFLKTRNLNLTWVSGVMFISLYASTTLDIVKPVSLNIIFVALVFQLAAILYLWIWR